MCACAVVLTLVARVYGMPSGKYYYEAKVTDEGLCRVGWSTRAAALDLGTDAHGYGFGGTGTLALRLDSCDVALMRHWGRCPTIVAQARSPTGGSSTRTANPTARMT